MKKIIFILIMCTWQTLLFAQGINDPEKLKFYLSEANKALKNKDYGFACDLYTHSLIYAEGVESGKYFKDVKNLTNQTCQAVASSVISDLNKHYNSPSCIARRKAKNECAAAIDFDKCVERKVGINSFNFCG